MIDTLAWILVGVALIPAHRIARGESRGLLAALVAIEIVALAMVLVASVNKPAWSALAQEDGVIEWATVLAFVMAAGWLVVVVRKRSPSWWFKGGCLLLAGFCLVVAGEEISWGQRLFGFKPPEVFLEKNFQQEANLHNVLMHEGGLGFKLESKHLVIAIVIGFGMVWPWIVRRERLAVFAPLAPSWAFVPLALAVVAAELSYEVELTGEGAELITGLLFLASALTSAKVRARDIVVLVVVPLVAGWLVSMTLARVVFGSDEAGSRVAAHELAQLATEVTAGATDKLVNRNVHKRVFTAMRGGYLVMPNRATKDRQYYSLDPWNNAYWIYFDKSTHTGAVYSFGPNRRRDLTIRKPDSDRGDDIIVRFAVP